MLYEGMVMHVILTNCRSLKKTVGTKLVLMVDWSTIELRCSNLKRWEGPSVYIRTLGYGAEYMASYSEFRLVQKVNGRHGCLTRIVATFVESLQRRGRYHWSGEVLL